MAGAYGRPICTVPGVRRLVRLARVWVVGFGVIAGVLSGCGAQTAQMAAARRGLAPEHAFRFEGDLYHYSLFVPPRRAPGSGIPLVVVIHGCNTSAVQQMRISGYDTLAKRDGFAVLYPDVDPSDVSNGDCWKALRAPQSDGRGRNDAGAIAAMTRAIMRTQRIDPRRVYALGISSGGFETSILGAAYPDLYTAIGILSGAAYMRGPAACPGGGDSFDPGTSSLARGALRAMGTRRRVMPVIVMHGDHDQVIPYACGRQALAQWLATDKLVLGREGRHRLLRAGGQIHRGRVPGGDPYTIVNYRMTPSCPLLQLWTIHGMGHYWSGGSATPALKRYSDPRGPSAAAVTWDFFSRLRLGRPLPQCKVGAAGVLSRQG